MDPQKMQVSFLHPRDSSSFIGEVAPQCTAAVALKGLQAPDATETGPFLDPPPPGRPYELVLSRTSTALTPNTTMAQAAVVDGDVLEVRQAGMGA